MNRVSLGFLSSCAAIGVVLVMTSAVPTAQADRPVPFKVGETLSYDVSWTSFVTAGTATLSVKERRAMGPGKSAYYLVAEGIPSSMVGKLYSLYYKAESLIDTKTLLPAMSTVYSDEGGRKRHKTTTFAGNGTVQYQIKTASVATSTVKVPATAQDPLGAIYILRALPLKQGLALSIPMTDSGKAYTMRVRVDARENVKSAIGTLPAWKVALTVTEANGKPTEDGNLLVWISDDARKLPLKFTAGLTVGSFQLTLAKVVG
jgi:hypothetical protein